MAVALDILAYDEQESEVTTTSTDWQNLITVNFSLSQPDTVIIMWNMCGWVDDDANWVKGHLYIDSVDYWDEAQSPEGNVTEKFNWGGARQITMTSGDHEVQIVYASNSGGLTVHAKYASLLVFRDAASAQSILLADDEVTQFYEI